MTIENVKQFFKTGTELFLTCADNKKSAIRITNLMMGNKGFSSMEIFAKDIKAIGEDKIEITIDMPVQVLRAWEKYSDNHYNK